MDFEADKGLGPQAYIDAHARDGSIDTKPALNELNDKIRGIAMGIKTRDVTEQDTVYRMQEGFSGSSGFGRVHESEMDDTSRKVMDTYKEYGASLKAGRDADRTKFYESVYSMEVQLSALDKSPDRAASDSKLSHDTVNELGKGYADFVDSKTGTDAGSKRFADSQAFLREERRLDSISREIERDATRTMGANGSAKDVQRMQRDVYATMESEGMKGGKLADWVSMDVKKELEKSGYEKTRSAIERQNDPDGPSSFFSKFKKQIPPGKVYDSYPESYSKEDFYQRGQALQAANAMKEAGSPETKVMKPVQELESVVGVKMQGSTRLVTSVPSIQAKIEAAFEEPAKTETSSSRSLPSASAAGLDGPSGGQSSYEAGGVYG